MPLRRAYLGPFAGSTMLACTALTGVSDLRIGDGPEEPTEPPQEAGTPVEDAAPTVADASDASSDAGNCDLFGSPAKLCVTFDGPDAHTNGVPTDRDFEGAETLLAPAPSIDKTVFASPPGSARFPLVNGHSRSFVWRKFPGATFDLLQVSAAIRIDAVTASDIDLIEVRFGDPPSRFLFLQWRNGGTLVLRDALAGTTTDYPLTGTLGPTFERFTFGVERGPGGNFVEVKVGDETALARTAIGATALPSTLTFIAGVTDADTTAPLENVWFDDYVATW